MNAQKLWKKVDYLSTNNINYLGRNMYLPRALGYSYSGRWKDLSKSETEGRLGIFQYYIKRVF